MANDTDRPDGCVRVGTWNVQWTTPGSRKAPLLTEVLAAPGCDILCVTEGDAGILPAGGHVIDGGTDWGYPLPKASPGRRKVLLWSRRPWTPVFDTLQDALPGGRLVAGRRDRVQWQDHLGWLSGFERLSYARSRRRTIILGDFNQRSPKGGKLHGAFQKALGHFELSTSGFMVEASTRLGANGVDLREVVLTDTPSAKGVAQLIDHIAHSEDLIQDRRTAEREGARRIGVFPKAIDGTRLSDHTGAWFDLNLRSRP